jgi:hypothetical protein
LNGNIDIAVHVVAPTAAEFKEGAAVHRTGSGLSETTMAAVSHSRRTLASAGQ